MTYVQHLSVRVPWHDTGWSGTVCADPLGNSSCVMLSTIGTARDAHAEAAAAGAQWNSLDGGLPPCVMERGGFMSGRDHEFRRTHPYAGFLELSGLREARIELPAYSVHGIPYFWLHRENADAVLQERPIPGFDPAAEDRARRILGEKSPYSPAHPGTAAAGEA